MVARLRLTTKAVNRGYYKGNRTGSHGAHTEWGGYTIDYRKTRNFNCPPNLSTTRLSPFVTKQIAAPMSTLGGKGKGSEGRFGGESLQTIRPTGQKVVKAWKEGNKVEYERKRVEWRGYLQSLGAMGEAGEVEMPTATATPAATPTTTTGTVTPTASEVATEASEPSQPNQPRP